MHKQKKQSIYKMIYRQAGRKRERESARKNRYENIIYICMYNSCIYVRLLLDNRGKVADNLARST